MPDANPLRGQLAGSAPWVSGDPTERFVAAPDGTRLFVRHWDGPRDRAPLVLCDGLGCDGYVWKYLVRRFAGERALFHLTYRGHGRSEVPGDLNSITVKQLIADLAHVLDDAGFPPAVFIGHSMGVQVCLESFRFARKRVRALALLCGSYQYPIDTWHAAAFRDEPAPFGNRVMRRLFEPLTRGGIARWERLRRVWQPLVLSNFALRTTLTGELNPDLVLPDDFKPYMEHLALMDMRVFATLARNLAAHSAADVLPTIDVPTLVVGGGRDKFCPLWISEDMHARLGDCRGHKEMIRLVLGSHTAPIEEPRIVERALLRLLERVDA